MPFATPRTRRTSQVIERFQGFPRAQLCHGFGAGSGGGNSSLRDSTGKSKAARRHRADTCTPLSRQASARFRPRPMTDSPFFARSIRCRTPLHRLRGMLSLIPTVANQRDSQKTSGASRRIQKAARLRPAKTSALARDATHGQDGGNSREIGHFSTAFISQPTLQRTEMAELTLKTN